MFVCKRCLQRVETTDRKDASCRYHPGLYVCRFHPNSAAASGDGLGYYGDGPKNDGWPAKFWDCCGAEDPHTPGCSYRTHTSYDDDDDDD